MVVGSEACLFRAADAPGLVHHLLLTQSSWPEQNPFTESGKGTSLTARVAAQTKRAAAMQTLQ
jgi:hypothetical protein